MRAIFKYCEHWEKGFAILAVAAIIFLISGLYSLPLVMLGELFGIDAITENYNWIYGVTCIVLGPFMISKYGPNVNWD